MYYITTTNNLNIRYYYSGNTTNNNRLRYKFSDNRKDALLFYNKNLALYYINVFNNKKKQKGVPLYIHGNSFILCEDI